MAVYENKFDILNVPKIFVKTCVFVLGGLRINVTYTVSLMTQNSKPYLDLLYHLSFSNLNLLLKIQPQRPTCMKLRTALSQRISYSVFCVPTGCE